MTSTNSVERRFDQLLTEYAGGALWRVIHSHNCAGHRLHRSLHLHSLRVFRTAATPVWCGRAACCARLTRQAVLALAQTLLRQLKSVSSISLFQPLACGGVSALECRSAAEIGGRPIVSGAAQTVEQRAHGRRRRRHRLRVVQGRRDHRTAEAVGAHDNCSICARSTCSGWAPTTVSTSSPSRMNSSIGMLRAS